MKEQVESTMDKELACAAVCTHQMGALFCVK